MKKILVSLIRGYQKINFLGNPIFRTFFVADASCRYSPTCSDYMIGSIERFGAAKGVVLGIKRIISCHPFSKGGFDPIPTKKA